MNKKQGVFIIFYRIDKNRRIVLYIAVSRIQHIVFMVYHILDIVFMISSSLFGIEHSGFLFSKRYAQYNAYGKIVGNHCTPALAYKRERYTCQRHDTKVHSNVFKKVKGKHPSYTNNKIFAKIISGFTGHIQAP